MPEFCCVVVLYDPGPEIELKIRQYALLFPFLCVIDNTPENVISSSLGDFFSEEQVLFIHNANVGGIARALNLGVEEAIKRSFQWVMTLDQDSEITEGMLERMWEAIQDHGHEKIALIAPYQRLETDNFFADMPEYEFPLFVMTSGNLLDVSTYQTVGPFDEQLVLDYVDHDYCLRLQLNGYKILRANRAVLNHKLGEGRRHRLFGRDEVSSNHSPLRRYYMTRNRLYTAFQYRKTFPRYFRREIRHFFRDIVMITLFEKEKYLKFRMMVKGVWDFFQGKKGSL